MSNIIIDVLDYKGCLDYKDSLLKCISDGFSKTAMTNEKFVYIVHKKINAGHQILVAREKNNVVSTLTLVPEDKFLHDGSLIYHIEDVATRKEYRDHGYSTDLLKFALDYAKKRGAYKVILDTKIPEFYERLGFKKAEDCMRINL